MTGKVKVDLYGDLNEQCRGAVKADDLDSVKMVVAAGADVNWRDHVGNSFLHIACLFQRQEIAEFLC
eukprot:TRINITY_DN11507_c0_g1_i1.p2 TRINITY_DN11507_c0_g1~~TRINITY_DN11507_c0_g1_i1.p2  ORF type:complete len:67 (+),score=10.17 TRINITY_DN11507_c0_g1_i1:256-456(+)